MQSIFYMTYILYMFFKTLFITNNKRNVEVDVIYIFFYLIELIFKTEVYFIFSLLNITFMLYYNKKQKRKFNVILFETLCFYILFIILFKPSIITLIILSLLDRFIILFFRRLNNKINILKIKRRINIDNLILIQTNYKDIIKDFLDFRYDVIIIENEMNFYKELNKKKDKFTRIIVSSNNVLNIKNVINFNYGKVNDILIDKKGDYSIKNIKYKNEKSIIKYCYNKDTFFLETNLISYYENKMALSLYVLGKLIDINEKELSKYIKFIKPKKLKVIKNNNVIISNTECKNINEHYEGFNLIKGKKTNKVIVTCGIDDINEIDNFIDKIVHKFTYIILVNNNNIALLYEKILEKKFDKEKIYMIENLNDYKEIISILKMKKTYILLDSNL